MKVRKVNAGQKVFLFQEEEVWHHVPAERREKIIKILAEILRDFYLRREANADERKGYC